VVNDQLETIMVESFDEVVRYAETHGVNNRIAAYMLAIDRVAFTISNVASTRRNSLRAPASTGAFLRPRFEVFADATGKSAQ